MPIITKKNKITNADEVIETVNTVEEETTMTKKPVKKIMKKTAPKAVEPEVLEENNLDEEDIEDTNEDMETDLEDCNDEEEICDETSDEEASEEDDDEDSEEVDSDEEASEEDEEEYEYEEVEVEVEDERYVNFLERVKTVVNEVKENNTPLRGRRLKDLFDGVELDDIKTVKSSNREENLNSIVAAFEDNGLGFLFEGLKFNTDKRAVADRILNCIEIAIADCTLRKGTGFGIFNTKIIASHEDAHPYAAINNEYVQVKNDTLKKEHATFRMIPAEFDPELGLIYNNENGTSELNIPGKWNKSDNTFEVTGENLFYEVGDVVNIEKAPKKAPTKKTPTGKTTTKKVVKKVVKKVPKK